MILPRFSSFSYNLRKKLLKKTKINYICENP